MTVAASRIALLAGLPRRDDVFASLIAVLVTVPVALASGLLIFAPLGQDFVAAGVASGLWDAIIAGSIAAAIATSSFIVTCPRVSPALVQSSLVVALLSNPVFAADHAFIVPAVFLCGLLAGFWQILFGAFGIAGIIKYTPHPVLAGFLNGVGLLIIASQFKPFFLADGHLRLPERPAMFFLMCATAGFIFVHQIYARRIFGAWAGKIPGPLAGLVAGVTAFHVATGLAPDLDLGPTLGQFSLGISLPLLPLLDDVGATVVQSAVFDILLISVVLALIATFESLLAFRVAQNLGDIEVRPVRDLVAQGVGNCSAAFFGGACSAATPAVFIVAYRQGGRTRWVGIVGALVIAVVAALFPQMFSVIPSAVLSAILITTGATLLDRWSIKFVAEAWSDRSPVIRRRAVYDLLVVLAVMAVTIFVSVIVGVIAGSLLACVIFIINMSRPVVRHSFFGHQIFSKRIRPTADMAILQETGPHRVVLQLEGVLFFGNADDLAQRVKALLENVDAVVLDLRAVTDIDVSGANVLRNLVVRSGERNKRLLFCNVPAAQTSVILRIAGHTSDAGAITDLDSALEWVEEMTLLNHVDRGAGADVLAVHEIDFFHGLTGDELSELEKVMTLREFAAGETVCQEGEDGDRMWLLLKGSVSVRLSVGDHGGSRRVASLARGTTVGEMALVESSRRSATIVADEHVVSYELPREAFEGIRRDHPAIAAKLLANLVREVTRRLRKTTADLRHADS